MLTGALAEAAGRKQGRLRGPLGRSGGSGISNSELARRYGHIADQCLEKYGRPLLARVPGDTGNWCARPGNTKNLWTGVILGIISNESHGNPMVRGDRGQSLGLMQIQPRWHVNGRYAACKGFVRSAQELFNPEKNICCGVAIMVRQQSQSRSRSIASIARPWSVTFDSKAGLTRRNSQQICSSRASREIASVPRGYEGAR